MSNQDVTTITKPATLGDAKARSASVPMKQIGGSFLPAFEDMGQVMEFAAAMAGAGVMVGPAVRNNPGACMAVTMMAGRFNLDPFMLSTKAYIVRNQSGVDTLNWEAQAVNAMILGSGVLEAPLEYEYLGEGEGRHVRVFGSLKGEGIREITTGPVSKIKAKSPLWSKDPDQQLAYYGSRNWARRHASHVLMGVYTEDELSASTEMVNVTPASDPAARLTASITGKTDAPEPSQEAAQADEDEQPTDELETEPDAPQQDAAATVEADPSEDAWHDMDEVEAVFSEATQVHELGQAVDTALALSWVNQEQAEQIEMLADEYKVELEA